MARPSKLTPELTDRICELLEKGMPIRLICDAVGISDTRFYDWMQKGEDGKAEFREFRGRVNTSKSKVIEDYLDRLKGYSENGSVYATTWFLERRCPEEFGKRDNLNIKSKNENENLNVNVRTPEEIEQAILNKLARIQAKDDSQRAD